MVKVGFICEGKTETMILSSPAFNDYCLSIGLVVTKVIDAMGCDNLLPEKIDIYVDLLERVQVQKIVILTDMDKDACITETKERIGAHPEHIVIIAVKQIEAWFLAATKTLQAFLNTPNFHFDFPENEPSPFDKMREIMIENTGRGITKSTGGKKNLAFLLLAKGYTVNESAAHPNCPSAAYFLKQLRQIAIK